MTSRLCLLLAFSLVLFQACADAGDSPADDDPGGPDAGDIVGDPEDCADGTDNDGDGRVDCFDPDCEADAACTETTCDDGLDDDADEMIDCQDPDCDGIDGCEHINELSCDDGFDNNGNTAIDCQDVTCDGVGFCEYTVEETCTDDNDNDGDGDTDCMDSDCDGVGTCESAERSCADGVDNDIDGATDCDDSDCAGVSACLVADCPAGTELVTGVAADTPLALPDSATATSVINIPDDGLVTRVSVGLSAVHTYPSDLDISLIAPDGATVLLTADHGSGDMAYTDTLFSDAATTSIADATEPFTGAFQPEEPLSGLLGSATAGDWTLQVVDDASIDTGTLNDYSIYLCHCAAPCAAETSCTDGTDDDGDGATDCEDPGCDGVDTCEFGREETCNDGVDNDADGLMDCDDSDCNGHADCVFPCPTGSTTYTFTSGDTPVAIPDSGTVTASVSATETGTIANAAIRLSATHTYDGDLDIFVASPAGTSVELSTDNGGTGENYTDTLFADGAGTSITDGSAPFTGAFIPEQPLSALVSEPANGTWVLTVTDDASADTGTLTQFEVLICVTP